MGVPMNAVPELQQNQTVKPNLMVQQQQQDDDKNTLHDDDIIESMQTKPIEDMDCTELKEFAMSFEKGWGNAVTLHDERCS